MSNQYHGSNKSKRGWRMVGICALCTCLAILGASLVGFISGGFSEKNPTNWFDKDRNPDNLLKVNDTYVKTHNTNRGIDVKVDKNGVIKMSGKATSASSFTVQTVTLSAGTYTISGLANPNIDEFSMYAIYSESGDRAYADTESATFTISEETSVQVVISWAKDYKISLANQTIKPVLVKGETAGEFYAK